MKQVSYQMQKKKMYSQSQYCVGKDHRKLRQSLEGEDRLVSEFIPMSRIRLNRRADGVRVVNFPRFTTLQIFAEIQNMMPDIKCEPEQVQGRIIFMSM